MSGFVALFDRGGGEVARDDLRTMLSTISHRGPDGSGVWYGDGVTLGHQQLQSTPDPARSPPPGNR